MKNDTRSCERKFMQLRKKPFVAMQLQFNTLHSLSGIGQRKSLYSHLMN